MAETECTVKNTKDFITKGSLDYEFRLQFKCKDRLRPEFKFNNKRQYRSVNNLVS